MEQTSHFPSHTLGRHELTLAALTLPWGLFAANCILFGGLSLGFALAGCSLMGILTWYRLGQGGRFTGFSAGVLGLCCLTCAGFAWSDDYAVKFVSLCCGLFGWNLVQCLMAGKNRRAPGSAGVILDVLDTLFLTPMAHLAPSFRGLSRELQSDHRLRRFTGVLWGLLLAAPVLLMVVPLLISADAAFEGVVNLLPEVDLAQWIATAIFGSIAFAYIFGQSVGLTQENTETVPGRPVKKLSVLTVNTALAVVSAVYVVYLVSQLAYFVGGFAGILPQGYTVAEYAVRGFFEMARLSAINLAVVSIALFAVKREGKAPLSTRVLCLFLGLVTEFLVLSAMAKMGLYIGSFGLTRRRVLVVAILIFLGVTTAAVSLHLFLPRLPYGKVAVVTALVLCCGLLWLDVDYQVAKYNVEHYRSGKLENMDVAYLMELGSGAMPWLEELAKDGDATARMYLEQQVFYARPDDFRDWNYHHANAADITKRWRNDMQTP